jgi:hypothetical protein
MENVMPDQPSGLRLGGSRQNGVWMFDRTMDYGFHGDILA